MGDTPAASIPELPFVDDLLAVAWRDLDAARGLLQRLLTIGDAALGSSFTVASLFIGVAFSDHRPAVVFSAVPLVIIFWYLDGDNWARFRRVANRIRDLEGLFELYVSALRETKTARPDALARLRQGLDHYEFGIERTLVVSTPVDIWKQNRGRLRWWLYAALAAVLLLCGLLWVPSA
jgi:hypothetical protein